MASAFEHYSTLDLKQVALRPDAREVYEATTMLADLAPSGKQRAQLLERARALRNALAAHGRGVQQANI